MYHKLRILFVVLLMCGLVAFAAPALAQNDPETVVSSFYTWYLDYTGYDEASDEFRNPLVDGSYRERDELSPDLIEQVAAIRETGGYHYDPFTCAQDVAESFEIELVDSLTEHDAAVLVHTYFGWNPRPNSFVVALTEQDGAWRIQNVICQESITPRGVTESFYNWYLTQVPAADTLTEEYPFLTSDLNARIQEARNQRELGDGDPVLCAQDIPQSIAVNEVVVGQDTATMLVREFFQGNAQPKTLTVELTNTGQWMIDAITCDVEPETVTELLYNEYIRFTRYDIDRNLDRTPISDWAVYPWAQYMSQDLLDELLATYRSEEALRADPFLCAQDLPEWVQAEPVDAGSEAESGPVALRVLGAYPSGPESFSTYDMTRVELNRAATGEWQITNITCAN